RGVERVKASGKEVEESERCFQMNREANNKAMRFWMWYHFMNHIRAQTSSSPFFVGAIAIGIWLVLSGEWTIGTLLPFTFWVGGFISTIDQLRGTERQINGQLPAINTLKRLMELEPAVQDAPNATYFEASGALSVQVKQVSFAHPGKDNDGSSRPVLQNVSFSIRPGQKVAIIGPSGVGKTTLLHMLLRSRDPDQGQVLLDGHDLRGVTQASFKRFVGYAPQGAPLFDGSIRELMLYGLDPQHRSRTSDDEIWAVLRAVKADFGERLIKGLDTKIGRDGLELSGGERQRLSAAMALMNPLLRLLIMDEPTSNLDSETQKGFQDGLNAVLKRGVTAIIVAHRLSTVMDCDQFIVLKPVDELVAGESQVEAVAGSFGELYELSPTFRRIAENEGLKIRPEISIKPEDAPISRPPLLFGDSPIDFSA
ncbi:ABC transporter ATP-binding protein/permease, partial [Patescibacteria group bacterium]|nr:ABC transporter ATP-binding protein/permease [Patescibacteria group bacterium]